MRGRKWSEKDILGFKLLGGSVVFIVALFVAAVWITSSKPVLDEHTLCPVAGESMRVAVLVDKSDKWAQGDVTRVKDILQSIYRNVPAQGRLTIYSIMGDGGATPEGVRPRTNVKLVFDACNPGSEAECNALYSNCRKVKRDYNRAFQVPLEQLEASLMLPGESSFSPLLETVGAMVKDNHGKELKLNIISDFMENHNRFRFYDVVPLGEEMIEEYPLPREAKIAVEGYFIQRRMHSMQLQKAVQAAWTEYFMRQDIPVTFKPVFTTD